MPIPAPEDQVQFLFKVQRLLSEGSCRSPEEMHLANALFRFVELSRART
jgi:hypothetical protein